MKLSVAHPCRVRLPARPSPGFTLVELYISTALMITCVIMGLFAVHLMGLREDQLLESKGGASDSARRNVNQLRSDIYGAKGWQIGTWNGTTFVAVSNDVTQQGNALIIYPIVITSNQIVNVSNYILYYFDASDLADNNGILWYVRSTNGVSGTQTICISNLINPLNFTGETFQGLTQTNRTYKNVIHATFQYSQFQYPLTKVGSNSLFNSYRIDLRATPHLPDGP